MSNPSANAKTASSCLVLLFTLIEANDWQKINSMFLSNAEGRKAFQSLAARVAKSSSLSGMTILHLCARSNPPSLLMRKIIELCPDAPRSVDCFNRAPLHVAAGTGASSSVIKVLVDAYPKACMFQDQDGKSPLHMACDNSCELFAGSCAPLHPPSYRTIDILLSASLDSAILEDGDGMSAIEYALFSSANLKTVQLIQLAAQKVMIKKADKEKASKSKKADEDSSTKKGRAVADKGFTPRGRMVVAPSA